MLKKSIQSFFSHGRFCASLRPRHWYILYGTKQKRGFLPCFIFQTLSCLKNGGRSLDRTAGC
jgi:hypothetical protein